MNSLLKSDLLVDLNKELKLFLAESSIVDTKGNVYSWLNPRHPGFVYPEIMGLYLNLSAQLTSTANSKKVSRQTTILWEKRSHAIAKQLQKLVPPLGGL